MDTNNLDFDHNLNIAGLQELGFELSIERELLKATTRRDKETLKERMESYMDSLNKCPLNKPGDIIRIPRIKQREIIMKHLNKLNAQKIWKISLGFRRRSLPTWKRFSK